MTNGKSIFNANNICVALLIIFTGVIFFIRSYDHVPTGDEVMYQYVYEDGDKTPLGSQEHKYDRKVESFTQAFSSQINHYKLVNGRFLVHFMEQSFTGHETVFFVLNTVLFFIFVLLLLRYSVQPKDRGRYSVWIFTLAVLLLLFPTPSSLWTSINISLNYLFPATLCIACLLFWRRLADREVTIMEGLGIALISLVFGITHEGYVVGVAGGIFWYYCFNYKEFRARLLWLIIPMYITAAVMIFSPGNMSRFFGTSVVEDVSLVTKIANGIDNLLHLKVFMSMLVLIAINGIFCRFKGLSRFIRENKQLVYVFILGFIFSLFANTGTWSHTFTELTSFIFILRYISEKDWFARKITVYIAILITIGFLIQQIILAKDSIAYTRYMREVISDYNEHEDGVVKYAPPAMSFTSKDYIRTIEPGKNGFFIWSLTVLQGTKEKPLELLKPQDYEALASPHTFFTPANKFPGNAPVYYKEGGKYLWIDPTALPDDKEFIATLKPVDFNHNAGIILRLKFMLFPDAYPSTEKLTAGTLHTRFGEYQRIELPILRKIAKVDTIQ